MNMDRIRTKAENLSGFERTSMEAMLELNSI
jgi:hypothetical protein